MQIDKAFDPPPVTLGRVVHYRAHKSKVYAAIVTGIDGDTVTLTTFPPGQQSGFPAGVRHGNRDTPNSWFWPPRA